MITFDHKTLDTEGLTKTEAVRISTEKFLQVIDNMKSEFASDVFANPKDNSFESSVNQIYQTFDGKELYPTLEEKAAMLLYLITKNHSFSDGNKRIAASCFLYFLDKNNMLYKNDKPLIDNGTLFALTLLIAESNPKEMETMKQIVVSVLNRDTKKFENAGYIGIVDSNGVIVMDPQIKQGYNEFSNVSLQNEFLGMMPIIRNFEANRQIFMIQNQNLQKVISQLGTTS